ncbi:MAG: hypothetical protein ABH860_01280, partial [bacterium]
MSGINFIGPKAAEAGCSRVPEKKAQKEVVKGDAQVHNQLLYEWTMDGKVLNLTAAGMKEILLDNNKDSEYGLLEMDWAMAAKAIAKDVFGEYIDEAKAAKLAEILKKDNYNYEKPADVLKRSHMTLGQAVVSVLSLNLSCTQHKSYENFVKSQSAGVYRTGSFPQKLSVNISEEFKKLAAEKPAPKPVPKPVVREEKPKV